jgi:hypothetical protein
MVVIEIRGPTKVLSLEMVLRQHDLKYGQQAYQEKGLDLRS